MRIRYVVIGVMQLLLIATSGILRRQCFGEIDFTEGQQMSLTLQMSFYSLFLWFVTILLAAVLSIMDKVNRTPILLLLVIVLPFVEFLVWLGSSF